MRISHALNMTSGWSDNDLTDGEDVVTFFALDERWRTVAAYSSTSNSTSGATQLERWVHHNAGIGGRGSSSYIDSVILRDRDVVTSGGSAGSTSDGVTSPGDALEERIYVLQNWRADVVATLGRTGNVIEWIQYTAYGSAITNPPGNADFNGDGGVDGGDHAAFAAAWLGGLLSADVNNDGGVDGDDQAAFATIWAIGESPKGGLCMTTSIRVGYAGYQWDGSINISDSTRNYSGAMAGLYHVRHRAYDPELGRWTRRDPIGYVDGMGLYEYVGGRVISSLDPLGLRRQTAPPYHADIDDAECGSMCAFNSGTNGFVIYDKNLNPIKCCICIKNIIASNPDPPQSPHPPYCPLPGPPAPGWIDAIQILIECVYVHETEHIRQCGGNYYCAEFQAYEKQAACLAAREGECKDNTCKRLLKQERKRVDDEVMFFKMRCYSDGPPHLPTPC